MKPRIRHPRLCGDDGLFISKGVFNRHFICALITTSFLCLAPHPAQATRFSGAYLLHVCEMDAKGKEVVRGGHTACQAYIAGVLDYHNVLQSLHIAPSIDICVPQNVSMGQLQAIVLRYLRAHGEHDAFIAAPAVTMAIYEIYPCK